MITLQIDTMAPVYNRFFQLFSVILLINACGGHVQSTLIVSIRSGDNAAVESLIEAGEDVNALSHDLIKGQYWKLTPLIRASMLGNIEIMELLIDAGADVNRKDAYGDTPLMAAVEFKHLEAANLLIENGADLDASKPDKTTALIIATRNGDLKSTKFLLRKGADPNIGLGSGDTALSLAAWRGADIIVQELIEYGAKADKFAFARNRENKNNEILKLLKKAEFHN